MTPAATAEDVFRLVVAGMPLAQAVREVHRARGGLTAGCNPAHRATPRARGDCLVEDRVPGHARAEAGLTHYHPLAGDVSAAVNVLCREVIRGVRWGEALARAGYERLPETREALREAVSGPGTNGGYAPAVLRAAVHFVHHA